MYSILALVLAVAAVVFIVVHNSSAVYNQTLARYFEAKNFSAVLTPDSSVRVDTPLGPIVYSLEYCVAASDRRGRPSSMAVIDVRHPLIFPVLDVKDREGERDFEVVAVFRGGRLVSQKIVATGRGIVVEDYPLRIEVQC